MKVVINTIMAHPRFGTAEPGTVLDLSEADAQALIECGAAERVEQLKKTSSYSYETAKLDDPAETAMQTPHKSSSGKTSAR